MSVILDLGLGQFFDMDVKELKKIVIDLNEECKKNGYISINRILDVTKRSYNMCDRYNDMGYLYQDGDFLLLKSSHLIELGQQIDVYVLVYPKLKAQEPLIQVRD